MMKLSRKSRRRLYAAREASICRARPHQPLADDVMPRHHEQMSCWTTRLVALKRAPVESLTRLLALS